MTTRILHVLVATTLIAFASVTNAEALETPAPFASGTSEPSPQSPTAAPVSPSPDAVPSPAASAALPPPSPSPAPGTIATPAPEPTVALPPAGAIPATLSLAVTGSPAADGAFLDVQIRAALDRAIRPTLRFGASVDYGPVVPWPLPALAAGSRAAVNVTVSIAGTDDSAPVTGVTMVTLENVAVAPMQPTMLFLSDDPEYLRSEGLIFQGNVYLGRPVRLYYYQSNLGLPRDVDVVLTATGASRVQLIASDSGPDRDVMSVGHNVTRDFLQYRQANEGSVVDVVPGTPFIVRHGLLLQNEVIAGAVDVHVVGGGPVTVSVVASHAGTRPDAYLSGPRVAFDGHRRHGVFDLTDYGTIAKSYTVGGPPVTAQYGGRIPTPRNVDPSDDGRDFGDYGIIRRLTFTLDNPTDDPHQVYLYEKPLAGSVRSSFFVDGQLKELDCVRAAQAYSVMTYELAPHSTGATTTITMTDGGSFYPLEFGVTDVQPSPYTPAYGAPDSCTPNLTSTPQATSAPAVSSDH